MKTKRILAVLMAAVMIFALCGCGSSSAGRAQSAPAAAYEEAVDAAYVEEPAMMAGGMTMTNTSAKSEGIDAPEEAPEDAKEEMDPSKIIYSADLSMETLEFDNAIADLEQMIKQLGGFVESSSVSTNSRYYYGQSNKARRADYTIRVPSEKFEPMLNGVSDIGNVLNIHKYTENITSQYYDTAARLKVYQAQEERLLELLKDAETVEDIITIEDKLTEVRYSIESMTTTLRNWDRQVSYSTVYLSVQEVVEYTPEPDIGFGAKFVNSIKSGLERAVDFLKGLAIVIAEALPTTILAVIFVLLVVFVVRTIVRKVRNAKIRRREKKAKKLAEKAAAAEEKAEKEKGN